MCPLHNALSSGEGRGGPDLAPGALSVGKQVVLEPFERTRVYHNGRGPKAPPHCHT
jgi:hypothetical protein